MSEFLIEASAVTKSFDGVPALRDGQLLLRPGEVHALCGGNGAGKSTFLGILMGLLRRDGGDIRIHGKPADFQSAHEAMSRRMAVITQELSPILDMTVAENIYAGREPTRFGLVDHRKMAEDARTLLADLRFDVPAQARMADLSLAKIQLVEIAKAISQDARILIMDEPTSAIGEQETHILFDAIRKLTASGVGVIYVSHRLDELFAIATRYTVFRDGRFIESGMMSDIDRKHLVRQIVGYEIATAAPPAAGRTSDAKPVLEVMGLSHAAEFQNVSVLVGQGEIVGVYGLMGSGRSEFLNAVFGIGPRSAGRVVLKGRALAPNRPDLSIAAGMTMITEDRKVTGLVLGAPIRHNISLSVLRRLSRLFVLRRKPERALSADLMKRLSVRAASDRLPAGSLSGGNQQKVVIARCLSSQPDLLICDEPTRGIDEGAKQEIYALLERFAAAGGAVLVCSSEAPEVLRLSSRIVVFKKGRVAANLNARGLSQSALLHEAS